jgi:branched-chain amino acid transport system permease protein
MAQLFLQLLVSGLVLGSAYALLSVSFGIIYSTTGVFHFAHAVVYTVTAYAAAESAKAIGVPLLVALAIGLVVGTLLGLLMELAAYRPMRRRSGVGLPIFLVSLGLTIAGANLVQIVFGPENVSLGGFPIHTIAVGRITFTNLDLVAVVVAWSCIGALVLFLNRTRYGRAILAARSNPRLAEIVGIRMGRVFLLAFGIGSFMVAVSALLFTLNGVASPNMGVAPILIGFIGVFLGGIGSIPGAALGGLVVGLATDLSGLWLSGDFAPVVVFGLLFVLLMLRPQGLLGRAAS